jgi:hypothetical protein
MNKKALVALTIFTLASAAMPTAFAQSHALPQVTQQTPIAAEKNPPGDIPDSQVFVTFNSPMGFSIKVPEGWARTETPDSAHFNDKYNALQVTLTARATVPDIAGLKAGELADLQKSPNAIRIASVKPLALPNGKAWVVHYGSNSNVNPVTNKAIRLENASYYYWKAGKLATLTLSAPAGADNVDQWQLISRSFKWQ